MSKYKHERVTKKNRNLTIALGILGAGVAGPLAMSGTASAASVDAWDKVAECESSGLWNRPDGDNGKSSGGLQFQPASWNDAVDYLERQGVDVSDYPRGAGHQAYKATKEQQIIAGEALLALQGPGAWTCNAMVGSPLQSSGPNASMFKGGVNPYPSGTGTSETPVEEPAPTTPTTPTTPDTSEPSTPAPSSDGATVHVVVKGDTLSKLAQKYYGDASEWPHIFHANTPPLHSDPNSLVVGWKLTIPKVVRSESSTPSTKTYTVKRGDTLYDITKDQTGDASLDNWKPLYEANKDVVGSDPDLIFPGQVLSLPWASESNKGSSTPTPAPKTPAPKPSTSDLIDLVKSLEVAPEVESGYDRDLFDYSSSTRQKVLDQEQQTDGSWLSIWDGKTHTDASDLEVDHTVALKEAWDSGANEWSADKRSSFANDTENVDTLNAITSSLNQSKSDQDGAWESPDNRCEYVRQVASIKKTWGLSVDEHEKSVMLSVAESCATPAPTTPAPKPTTPSTPSASYVSPVDARVSQVYGNPNSGYTLGYHTGVDFSAPQGTPVKAVSNGTVVASDTSSAYGINVQIRNADGTYSLYAHLSAKSVSVGQTVTAGQQIGNVGSTGNSSGPHLHFEIRNKPTFGAGNFLNPLTWFASHGVTL